MEAVQVYKTEDGKMFDTAEEAASHEDSVAAKAKEESFRAALNVEAQGQPKAVPLERSVGRGED